MISHWECHRGLFFLPIVGSSQRQSVPAYQLVFGTWTKRQSVKSVSWEGKTNQWRERVVRRTKSVAGRGVSILLYWTRSQHLVTGFDPALRWHSINLRLWSLKSWQELKKKRTGPLGRCLMETLWLSTALTGHWQWQALVVGGIIRLPPLCRNF